MGARTCAATKHPLGRNNAKRETRAGLTYERSLGGTLTSAVVTVP